MTLEERFDAACATEVAWHPELELLPVRLSRACVAVLSVAGAGISALAGSDLRLPIGASDETASYVERLQFTYGDGPCLRAFGGDTPVTYPAPEIARLWPEFHRNLTSLTPYRAVMSLPLRGPDGGIGAVDLYLLEPAGLTGSGPEEAAAVAARMGRALTEAAIFTAEAQSARPAVVRGVAGSAPAAARIQVWRAMGLMNLTLELSAPDALAVLRARAYSTDRLVDELADDIVAGRLDPKALRL